MTVWADADSLPREVREIVARRSSPDGIPYRAAFVSAKPVPLPPGRGVLAVVTEPGLTADDYILREGERGDLVVTRDIPLAARALEAGLGALNDRGDEWTAATIGERLSLRDAMSGLRETGLAAMPRGRSYGPKEVKAFADAFDRALARRRPKP